MSDVLAQARRGTLPGMVRTGASFADAAAEYLRYVAEDRGRKRTTIQDYRSIIDTHLLPAFGERRLEDISPVAVETFQAELARRIWRGHLLTARTRNKILVVLHGIFQRARKVWGLPLNPVAEIERHPGRNSGDIEVFSPEEVHALARAAANDQDAALYVTAAFTGMRMGELRAVRWRDVDFARSVVRVRGSFAAGELASPKSCKVRSVPLVDEAARRLAQLGSRKAFTADDDLVFCEADGTWLSDDRVRRRYATALASARLRPLRFDDLRHTFGSLAISRADIVEVQAWMGHADVKTTMRYLHYRDRGGAAERLAAAFQVDEATAVTA